MDNMDFFSHIINSKDEWRIELLQVLRAIPSHRESFKTITQIVEQIAAKETRWSSTLVYGLTFAAITFLDLFGVLEWNEDKCRFADQIPDYFRHSLCWYLENQQELFTNWLRPGAAREVDAADLPEMAPSFLRVIEERRLELAQEYGIEPGYSRVQPSSLVFIKGINNDRTLFLHQWDIRAEEYQLIGGKQRANESPLDTAKREMGEEVSNKRPLKYDRDYELIPLVTEPIETLVISRTYGALTQYQFWLYGAKFKLKKLPLSQIDRWLTIEEMLKGTTNDGLRVRDPSTLRLFLSHINMGFDGIPISIAVATDVSDGILSPQHLRFISDLPKYFNFDELKELATKLGLDSESISGENRSRYATELVLYVKRRGRFGELFDVCKRERPNADWE